LGVPTLTAAQEDRGHLPPRDMPSKHTQECAACHTAYPPGMELAASWVRIMSGLGRHQRTDAALDAATVTARGIWLQTHAGTCQRVQAQPPEDRIARSVWLLRERRKPVPTAWSMQPRTCPIGCLPCALWAPA
jgi:hypothetical protein